MLLKRSQINASIALAMVTFRDYGISLPEFAYWTVEDWMSKGPEADEIRACMLGWDVTDFGQGDFTRIGRTLFTLRNGSMRHESPNGGYDKSYAEKLILDPEGQRSPAHFHRTKMEDIINRAGGNIIVQLTKAGADNRPSDAAFTIAVDGVARRMRPGDSVRLKPGQSVCIPPRTIHQFWGEDGTGLTVSGEVSSLCDDHADNCFLEPSSRFPEIEEDAPRRHFLCTEYPQAVRH
ncbi:D-lyxose/D-mannose family sugar isomerase [Nguyenibacter vanlangensis]|uniref:D-lyxose ketol-isomerase n=1 Tax=Nguyenibacter vanlangensis TaxID=1216886 RepID=A0A7Y7IY31_9PROT|nr:D-lyxose/D-mannose family sugar isomerase [Nguyenibacter vanlangensis]NVN12498.1 D-lyxose/D-mannose family sugar isomerase [Nguyenibacter vanlangensis]